MRLISVSVADEEKFFFKDVPVALPGRTSSHRVSHARNTTRGFLMGSELSIHCSDVLVCGTIEWQAALFQGEEVLGKSTKKKLERKNLNTFDLLRLFPSAYFPLFYVHTLPTVSGCFTPRFSSFAQGYRTDGLRLSFTEFQYEFGSSFLATKFFLLSRKAVLFTVRGSVGQANIRL